MAFDGNRITEITDMIAWQSTRFISELRCNAGRHSCGELQADAEQFFLAPAVQNIKRA